MTPRWIRELLQPGDLPGYWGSGVTVNRRREAMRVHAAATHPEFRKIAFQVAATMPEARDIPECMSR
jgi:hypothetical protein